MLSSLGKEKVPPWCEELIQEDSIPPRRQTHEHIFQVSLLLGTEQREILLVVLTGFAGFGPQRTCHYDEKEWPMIAE